eukprot:scaffold109719_cov47-Prasinocladus_malaysianus.AAC.1
MAQSRAFAAPAADPFMDIFKKQQQTYRSLLEKTKDLKVPDKNDKKGIEEFATKLSAIRKEVSGMANQSMLFKVAIRSPDLERIILCVQLGLYWSPEDYKQAVHARMDALKADTDGTMRDFISKCNTIGVDPAVQKSLLSALDDIEGKLGRPMLASGDKEGQPLFDAALEGVRKETGYDKMSDKDMLAKGDYDTVCLYLLGNDLGAHGSCAQFC